MGKPDDEEVRIQLQSTNLIGGEASGNNDLVDKSGEMTNRS
jgi:hypothetical protein